MSGQQSELAKRIWGQVLSEPQRDFWIEREHSYTFRDLEETLRWLTVVLRRSSLEPDDRLVIACDRDWTAFTAWLCSILNGLVPIMVAHDAGNDRLRAIVSASSATHVLTDASRRQDIASKLPQVNQLAIDFHKSGAVEHDDDPSLLLPRSGNAYILFTSGTTSSPKGVVITQRNLASQLATIARVFRVDRRARLYNGLVLHHVDGLVQGPLLCAAAGATLLRPKPFHPSRIEEEMSWLASAQATHMVSAPPLLEMVLRGARRDDYFQRADFVAVLSSSAKLPKRIWERFEERFGVPIINEYGMTETVAATHFAGPFPEMGGRNTIGRPIDCEARVVDSEGRDVKHGQAGELVLRGANIFSGYLNDPERTAEVFVDGWFRTGDLVTVSSTGDYEIVGRIKTTINFAGFLIQPEEIDEAICRHPNIRDAVTVGVEDEVFGQVPCSAFIADRPIDPNEVFRICRTHLEARKVPRHAVQIEKLPRTASGKPDLPAIRQFILAKLGKRAKPGGDLVERLLEIAAGVFGVPANSLQISDTPETTPGWDSFAQTTLALEVEAAFGVTLSAHDVLGISSLAELANALSREILSSKRAPASRLQIIHEGRGAGSIVVLPDLGGRAEYIRNIVGALDPAISVHSLTADQRGIRGGNPPTMREIAEDFGAELLSAKFTHPLVLLGHSFGGYLAYETASYLDDRGEASDGVVLLDTAVPWRHRSDAQIRRLTLAARKRLKKWRGDAGPRGDILWEPGFWRIDLTRHPESQRKILRAWYQAMISYEPTESRTSILLFRAVKRWDRSLFSGRALGWRRFTSGEIKTVRLGHDHLSQIRNPRIASAIATEINEHFRSLSITNQASLTILTRLNP